MKPGILNTEPGPFWPISASTTRLNLEIIIGLLPLLAFKISSLDLNYLHVILALGISALIPLVALAKHKRFFWDLDWLKGSLLAFLIMPAPEINSLILAALVVSLVSLFPGFVKNPGFLGALVGLLGGTHNIATSPLVILSLTPLTLWLLLKRDTNYKLIAFFWCFWMATIFLCKIYPDQHLVIWWSVISLFGQENYQLLKNKMLAIFLLLSIGLLPILNFGMPLALALLTTMELVVSFIFFNKGNKIYHCYAQTKNEHQSNHDLKVARLCGREKETVAIISLNGQTNCSISKQLDQGPYACPKACLGLGDCLRACPFGAIKNNQEKGLPPILIPELCTGCGKCLTACPQKLMILLPQKTKVIIPCQGQAKMKIMDLLCSKGCLSCGRCRKSCPARAINKQSISAPPEVNIKICINYKDNCQMACIKNCPKKIPLLLKDNHIS